MKLGIKNRELEIKNKAVSSRVYRGISVFQLLTSNFSLLIRWLTSNFRSCSHFLISNFSLLICWLTSHFRSCLQLLISNFYLLIFFFLLPNSSFAILNSTNPSDLDFFQSHIFEEPLVPIGGTTSANENKALAQALLDYQKQNDPEKTGPITSFLETHPNSVWRASLLTNLGLVYIKTGWFSKAIDTLEKAWKLSKNETDLRSHAIADRAVSELADLYAKLGDQEHLELLLTELQGREVMGSVTEKIASARGTLGMMKNHPETAFRCGAFALGQILASQNSKEVMNSKIMDSKSTDRGMSLNQIASLAHELGMDYQIVFREVSPKPRAKADEASPKHYPSAKADEASPKAGDWILPAIIHWKLGHYSALIRKEGGRFLIQDPSFESEIWMSLDALNAEASGYYLVPGPALRPVLRSFSEEGSFGEGGPVTTKRLGVVGYRPVDPKEAETIWGKGVVSGPDLNATSSLDIKSKPSSHQCGMADYNFHVLSAGLNITDIPLGYTPPRGLGIYFTATYNQHEANQPGVFTYSNLGPKWTFDWLSYIQDDPNNGSAIAKLFMQGGGAETYTGFDVKTQSYSRPAMSQSLLTRTSTSPIKYERQLPDGSKEIFEQSDGAKANPRKIFLTQMIDPQGNTTTFNYDTNLRMTEVVDAINKKTSIQYVSDDPKDSQFYLVKQVTDPFGRSAKLEYDNKSRLTKISDVIGITSSFNYEGNGDFINKLMTPYGSTIFNYGEAGVNRWLQATDPKGDMERVEFFSSADIPSAESVAPQGINIVNQYLNYRDSFYWDKKTMKENPGDYTQARIYHWLHISGNDRASRILESEKKPLENRVWYSYPGQNIAYSENPGMQNQPSKVARVLDDGTTQLSQFEYNDLGKMTKSIDPLGRQTVLIYAPNQLDLLEVRQILQQPKDAINVLAKYTYNNQHLPLTATDAAGQTTIFTYTPNGQLETLTNPKGEKTTRTYDNNSYLITITGPDPKSVTKFTYDNKGRINTVTDSEGYVITMDYDNLDRPTKITYPDKTTEEIVYDKLDPIKTKDRLNRWTYQFYNAMRQIIAVRDAQGRVTTLGWCACGALDRILDPLGQVTRWKRDVQGRVMEKVYPDGSKEQYTYENTTSRLKSFKDPKGQVAGYQYNKDNTIKQVSYSNTTIATPPVNFEYDPNFNRISKMTDGTGVTAYNYNPVALKFGSGMLGSIVGPMANSTITYDYDELGRTKERGINGVKQSAVFDNLGRVTKVTNALGDFINDYVNATGRLKSVTYPNKQKTMFSYFDNLGDQRLKEIRHLNPNSSLLTSHSYSYNPVGNITQWVQQIEAQDPKTYNFGYDQADQLTGVNILDSQFKILNSSFFTYDKAGNRLSEQIDTKVTLATFNNLNQLIKKDEGAGPVRFEGNVNKPAAVNITKGNTTVPANVDVKNNFNTPVPLDVGTNTISVVATDYTPNKNTTTNNYKVVVVPGGKKILKYDLNGNLIEISIPNSQFLIQYGWDAVNRLVKITQGMNVTEFVYDGLNRRVAEKLNGSVIKQWVWCGMELCEERDANGAVTKRFYPWGVVIVSGPNAGSYFYTRDHLGSIREVTDNMGVVKARYDFDSYGRRTLVSGTDLADFGYTGYYFHAASGLYLAPYRAYFADDGRYISRDPIGEQMGRNHLYGYVHENPINWIDPLGLDVWIEGPNPNEPNLHQSINVGDPNGDYNSYSFGMNGRGIEGEVYKDDQHGGAIERYKQTTPDEDKAFKDALDKELGDTGLYGIDDICRSYSQRKFKEAPGKEVAPPKRTIPAVGPKPTIPSTTTRTTSTTGTSTSR